MLADDLLAAFGGHGAHGDYAAFDAAQVVLHNPPPAAIVVVIVEPHAGGSLARNGRINDDTDGHMEVNERAREGLVFLLNYASTGESGAKPAKAAAEKPMTGGKWAQRFLQARSLQPTPMRP